MANANLPKSFKPLSYDKQHVLRIWAAASLASKGGIDGGHDILCMNSAGRAAAYGSDPLLGLQLGGFIDQDDLTYKTTAAVDDYVDVIIDPNVLFRGQLSSFAKADPYTTRNSAGCFDVAGNAGVQYVDAAATTNKSIRVIGLAKEEKQGTYSEIGANAQVLFRLNLNKHFTTTVS